MQSVATDVVSPLSPPSLPKASGGDSSANGQTTPFANFLDDNRSQASASASDKSASDPSGDGGTAATMAASDNLSNRSTAGSNNRIPGQSSAEDGGAGPQTVAGGATTVAAGTGNGGPAGSVTPASPAGPPGSSERRSAALPDGEDPVTIPLPDATMTQAAGRSERQKPGRDRGQGTSDGVDASADATTQNASGQNASGAEATSNSQLFGAPSDISVGTARTRKSRTDVQTSSATTPADTPSSASAAGPAASANLVPAIIPATTSSSNGVAPPLASGVEDRTNTGSIGSPADDVDPGQATPAGPGSKLAGGAGDRQAVPASPGSGLAGGADSQAVPTWPGLGLAGSADNSQPVSAWPGAKLAVLSDGSGDGAIAATVGPNGSTATAAARSLSDDASSRATATAAASGIVGDTRMPARAAAPTISSDAAMRDAMRNAASDASSLSPQLDATGDAPGDAQSIGLVSPRDDIGASSQGLAPAPADPAAASVLAVAAPGTVVAPASSSSGNGTSATSATENAVPIGEVGVAIAAQAQSGKSRFEIRLDPPQLGRIDVQLSVDPGGNVTSHLVVERPETLDLLRQDAPQLERALQSAGLDTSGGMQFSLADRGFANPNWFAQPSREGTTRAASEAAATSAAPLVTASNSYATTRQRSGGIDIRV